MTQPVTISFLRKNNNVISIRQINKFRLKPICKGIKDGEYKNKKYLKSNLTRLFWTFVDYFVRKVKEIPYNVKTRPLLYLFNNFFWG